MENENGKKHHWTHPDFYKPKTDDEVEIDIMTPHEVKHAVDEMFRTLESDPHVDTVKAHVLIDKTLDLVTIYDRAQREFNPDYDVTLRIFTDKELSHLRKMMIRAGIKKLTVNMP